MATWSQELAYIRRNVPMNFGKPVHRYCTQMEALRAVQIYHSARVRRTIAADPGSTDITDPSCKCAITPPSCWFTAD